MKRGLALFLLALLLFPSSAYAHPGKTDENGGHYDYSTGEYHYHHGYPAHQHVNGVCPYDYKDNTASSPRSYTSVDSQADRPTTAPRPTSLPRSTVAPAPKVQAAEPPPSLLLLAVCAAGGGVLFALVYSIAKARVDPSKFLFVYISFAALGILFTIGLGVYAAPPFPAVPAAAQLPAVSAAPTQRPTSIPAPSPAPASTPKPETAYTYIAHKITHVFHDPACYAVNQISASNQLKFTRTRSRMIADGYTPCPHCKP